MEKLHTLEHVAELRQQISGTVLLPEDSDYDVKRRGWNLTVDQHPAVIVIVNDVQDVQAAVRYAAAHDLGVAVQLTGHGIKYAADNLLIITERLKGVTVDVQRATARVEAGVIWQQVLDAATPHGLAPLLGTSPNVGVVGYTLSGGIGFLARRFGLAADSVLAIDVVTLDGQVRHTSATENSDLFWAILGGGGNFGVITAMEFKLYPVPTLYGGSLTYPGDQVADVMRFYREWVKGVPEELGSMLAIVKYPAMPQLPEAIRGKVFAYVRAAYSGDAAQGQALIQPWLDWQTPLENTFREMPFAEAPTITNDPTNPSPVFSSSDMLNELSDEVIEIVTRYATNSNAPVVLTDIRHAGGAISRADSNANAIGNRDANFYLVIGGPAFTPETRAAMQPYIDEYKSALRPYLHGGLYLNFAGSIEARKRVKDAYSPESYARLLTLKGQYDPKNLFRYSFPLVTQP